MEVEYYNYGEEGGVGNYQIGYNSDGIFSSWISLHNSSSYTMELEKNEKGWISAVSTLFNGNLDYKDVYTYYNDGNLEREVRYSDISGSTESIEFDYFYTYTDFGEIETLRMQYPNDENSGTQWEYTYDENRILIQRYREITDNLGRERTDTYFYGSEEHLERILVVVGDYISDYVAFFPNGDPKIVETSYQGFLYEIVTWDEDGYSQWKIIDEETGQYRIEYKDPEENLLRTEYYSATGELR